MNTILQHLMNSRSILLASHTNPDGDAIGSLIAMGLCLDGVDKVTTLYNESPIPDVYRYLPSVDRVVGHLPEYAAYDTGIILDCGDIQRIGGAADRICRLPVIINIDHHVCWCFHFSKNRKT